MAEAEPLLEARNLVKHYGQVLALDGANFTAYPGEVVALIGDNGAGKSTLVKALSGTIRPDGGDILVGGNVVHLSNPLDARRYGIETVYQDLALAPDLDAAANLHLGREIYRLRALGVLNKPEMRRRAIAVTASIARRRRPSPRPTRTRLPHRPPSTRAAASQPAIAASSGDPPGPPAPGDHRYLRGP